MIGTPFHFLEPQLAIHERMCTLLTKQFGHFKLTGNVPEISGLVCQDKSIKELLYMMNQRLPEVISFPATEIEKVASNYANITTGVSKLSLDVSKKSKQSTSRKTKSTPEKIVTPELLEEHKKEFYESFNMNLYYCQSYCTYIFKALYNHKQEGIAKNTEHFNQSIGYFLLLASILNLNMLIYHTHPIRQKVDIERMRGLFKASNNWTILLESFHLDYGQGADFNELRTLFVKRMIDFKQQLFNDPKYIDLLPEELFLPLSIEELNYHVAQKNLRALSLGLGYLGQVYTPDVNTLYIASQGSEKEFLKKILMIHKSPSAHLKTQFLYFYNEPNGNVDVFDVKLNTTTGYIEIINVHVGNSCAQHDLISRLDIALRQTKVPFQILACQADLGPRTQTASLYAFKLSSLLAKKSFAEIKDRSTTQQPTFSDEANVGPQKLDTIPGVHWFPIETLGDKAVLLISSLAKRKALLKDRFDGYQKQYGLSEMTHDDPATLYHYADDYRKRLALRYYQNSPFATLSIDALRAKMEAKDDGQLIRRGASSVYKTKTREFEFLVNYMKEHQQEATLHLPAKEKDYTPLQWALRGQSAKKAAILFAATSFTEEELNEKNKDNKSAKDYFAESKDPKVTGNPVLKRFLSK